MGWMGHPRGVAWMTSYRVLLVEDELSIRMMIAEVLRDEGYVVAEAWDGDEAVRLLNGGDSFDMMCTDVRMPGMRDGIDVAVYAQSLYLAIPVLVVSGYAGQLKEQLRMLVPAATFIAKPYQPYQIVAAVRTLSCPGSSPKRR